MPEIILITLAKILFRILKNEVRNKKNRKGGCTPPINCSPIKANFYAVTETDCLRRINLIIRIFIKIIFFGGPKRGAKWGGQRGAKRGAKREG